MKDLLKLWESDWFCLFEALERLNQEDSEKEIFIRNIGQIILAAINQQLFHYYNHGGQKVLIEKWLKIKIGNPY